MNKIPTYEGLGDFQPALAAARVRLAGPGAGPPDVEAGVAARAVEALTYWTPASLKADPDRRGSNELDRSTQLLANMSHDLLTPITRMKLHAETVSAPAVRQKLFSDLDEMEALVREVLDYAGSTRRATARCVELDLTAFVNSVACDYQDMHKDVVPVAPVAAVVRTRPPLLRRILTNLVDNALKFAGAAEIVLETRHETHVSIAVLDRGPGIPPEKLAVAIRPFFRLARGTTPGLGLGLAIAENLAGALNGSLALHNRAGGGLRAEMRLPVA